MLHEVGLDDCRATLSGSEKIRCPLRSQGGFQEVASLIVQYCTASGNTGWLMTA
jgi:hypothetical protein